MRRRVTQYFDGRSPHVAALALIVLAVLVANAVYLLGQGSSDPIAWTASIAHSSCGLICGRPSIDANVGNITQPLGHLVATDLLHGHLPWWNPFEGLGQPLAGEMQSAALFPLTVLLALPTGLLWFHLILEVTAGVATYFLLRRLSLQAVVCVVGGVLFAVNGTFAWLANSVVNPLAFLPLLLLGIEVLLSDASCPTKKGWYLVAIALALSLYAGFPEVSYFNALFALVWAVTRLFSISAQYRARALRRLGVAVVAGVALSAAILVPFVDFLKVSYSGGHTAAIDGSWALSFRSIPMLFDPYVYGSIYQNVHVSVEWGEVGGYFGAGVVALALVGAWGQRRRTLRIVLASWIFVALAGAFNLLGARKVWNLLPFVTDASLPRYIMPSCELAVILLAVLGLSDLADNGVHAKRRLVVATVFMTLVVVLDFVLGRPLNDHVVLQDTGRVLFALAGVLPFVSLALVLVFNVGRSPATRVTLVGAVVVAESLLLFIVPTLAAPTHVRVDDAPLHYLQRHQGEERFVDLSVLYPNWGSEFSINSINAIDLPFPETFKNLIQSQLYPGLRPRNAFTRDRSTQVVAQEIELAAHLRDYEDASVKYLLAPRSLALSTALRSFGVTAVFRDRATTIYELPHARPFFSTPSPCHVSSTSIDVAHLSCSRATTLLRTELSMSGWHASVSGRPTVITTVDGAYQELDVPKGSSTVVYSFVPPNELLALTLSLCAALFLVASRGREFRRARRAPAKSLHGDQKSDDDDTVLDG
jgi:Bacterial membrane protein YfhO